MDLEKSLGKRPKILYVSIKEMAQKGSIAHLILIAILSVIVFIFGYFSGVQNIIERNLIGSTEEKYVSVIQPIEDKCEFYGYLRNQSDYLPIYRVNKDDTLTTIARDYLGDTERFNEIIELNKYKYKNLFRDSFLEIGWELFMPPSFSFPTAGLAGYSGEVMQDSDQMLTIEIYSRVEKDLHPLLRLMKVPETVYFDKRNYEVGDCVGVLVEAARSDLGNRLVAVAPEKTFKMHFTNSLKEK